MHNEFTYIIHPPMEDDPGYAAFCVEVPEASGQGDTREAALDNLREGIEMVLEYRREQGLRGLPAEVEQGMLSVG